MDLLPLMIGEQPVAVDWAMALVLATAAIAAGVALRRVALAPLREIARFTRQVDLLEPGQRLPVPPVPELVGLAEAVNQMLERLERERAESSRRTIGAQTNERARIARELHDQVGQCLSAVLLQMTGATSLPAKDLEPRLEGALEAARTGLDELVGLIHRLRPETLDGLGLSSALTGLCTDMSRSLGLPIVQRVSREPTLLGPDEELAVYWVAQEALANVARHAGAEWVWLSLHHHEQALILRVDDDGRGLPSNSELRGIRGMRERAVAYGASLTLSERPGGGSRVEFAVPTPADATVAG